jgi:hypothetical protein
MSKRLDHNAPYPKLKMNSVTIPNWSRWLHDPHAFRQLGQEIADLRGEPERLRTNFRTHPIEFEKQNQSLVSMELLDQRRVKKGNHLLQPQFRGVLRRENNAPLINASNLDNYSMGIRSFSSSNQFVMMVILRGNSAVDPSSVVVSDSLIIRNFLLLGRISHGINPSPLPEPTKKYIP